MSQIFHSVGIMTGTSLDGVDLGYIETDGKNFVKTKNGYTYNFPDELKNNLKNLIQGNLDRFFYIENEYTQFVAECVNNFIQQNNLNKIDFLGFHGQTIFHDPNNSVTKQIGNSSLLSAKTGLDVISNFREADIAHGGQGAPLIPVFHAALAKTKPCTFLNIGGVSNITYIDDDNLIGFDCGPGNALIDDFCFENFGSSYDENGKLASQGNINETILNKWLQHEYFASKYPKSLDRNDFQKLVTQDVNSIDKFDAIATLSEFTVKCILISVSQLPQNVKTLYAFGGGIKNKFIIDNLRKELDIKPVSDLGINPDFMESYAFGYLAVRSSLGLEISYPSATGVSKAISGGIHTKSVNF